MRITSPSHRVVSHRRSRISALPLSMVLLVLAGCGGSNQPPPDTTPPSTPAGLTAVSESNTQIDLTWSASTNNVTVTNYIVQRCQGSGCSSFSQIATPTTTSYDDTGLTPSTSYSYRVEATDAGGNLSGFSATATASTAAAGAITVTISPKNGGVVISQTLALTASVNNDVNGQGVTWTKSGGTFTNQTTSSVSFSSAAGGAFTITATSNADNTKSASVNVGVTDLVGNLTWRYDNTRAGANLQEFALTPANVNTSSFGKLFACQLDSPVYAQPLWVPNLAIGGGTHNVIFVGTVHDTVYAFDADSSPCVTYWQKSLLGANETWVASTDVSTTDIYPDIGIIGTPVIDSGLTTLYVVAKSKTTGTTCSLAADCFQRLHALNLADGTEKFGGPVLISASVAGTGDGSETVTFNPLTQNERPALTYLNGVIYIAWASHGDNGTYHGWILDYNATSLAQMETYNASPDGGLGGIWMSGNGLAVDESGNLYAETGNGDFDGQIPPISGADDFGDSVLRFSSSGALSPKDYFTPHDQSTLDEDDIDLAAGGIVILPDQSSGGVTHLLFVSSKSGTIYLLNRDDLGGYDTDSDTDGVVQEFIASASGFWSTPAFWQGAMYAGASGDSIVAWPFNHNMAGKFDNSGSSFTSTSYGFPGASPVVSSSGATNGIVWAIDSSAYGVPCCANGPAILHAYDATNLANELWNSSQVATDTAENAVKLTVPLVANGKVYVGTRSEIDVYGLNP